MNAAAADLHVRWLGRMEFAHALALQEEIVLKKRDDRSVEDQLLLLEHEPVYTIGRTPDRSSLSATGRIRHGEVGTAHLPHPLFVINRGGQATYHGPGQLMGYPIIDLRRCGQDLHKYLRWLEQLLIDLLARYDIAAAAARIAYRSLGRRSQDWTSSPARRSFSRRWRSWASRTMRFSLRCLRRW